MINFGERAYDYNLYNPIDSTNELAKYHKQGVHEDTVLENVRTDLNALFKDSICNRVYISNNTDKSFFGIKVLPTKLSPDDIEKMMSDDNPKRISTYVVDIDSKLFGLTNNLNFNKDATTNNTYIHSTGLSDFHIWSLIVYEVSNLINTNEPIIKTRDAIHEYITIKNFSLMNDFFYRSHLNNSLFYFAMCDTINKFASVFYTNAFDPNFSKNNFIPNEFIANCMPELTNTLEEAIDIIRGSNVFIGFNKKLVTLQWFLTLIIDSKHTYFDAIETIDQCIDVTGSTIERNRLIHIKNLLNRVEFIDINDVNGINESTIMHKVRSRGIINIENELYEYAVRIKTATTESEARCLIREINNRMDILSDYMENELTDDDTGERDRLQKIYDKYSSLRDKLTQMPITKYKYLQLWVDGTSES